MFNKYTIGIYTKNSVHSINIIKTNIFKKEKIQKQNISENEFLNFIKTYLNKKFDFLEFRIVIDENNIIIKFDDFPDIPLQQIEKMLDLEYDKYFISPKETSVYGCLELNNLENKKKVFLFNIQKKCLTNLVSGASGQYNFFPERAEIKLITLTNHFLNTYNYNNFLIVVLNNNINTLIFIDNKSLSYFRTFDNDNISDKIKQTIVYYLNKNNNYLPEKIFISQHNDFIEEIFNEKYPMSNLIIFDESKCILESLTENNKKYKINLINKNIIPFFVEKYSVKNNKILNCSVFIFLLLFFIFLNLMINQKKINISNNISKIDTYIGENSNLYFELLNNKQQIKSSEEFPENETVNSNIIKRLINTVPDNIKILEINIIILNASDKYKGLSEKIEFSRQIKIKGEAVYNTHVIDFIRNMDNSNFFSLNNIIYQNQKTNNLIDFMIESGIK